MIKKILKKLRWLICKRLIYERECRPREYEGCFQIRILDGGKKVDEFWAEYMTIKGDDTIELNKKIIQEKNNGQKIKPFATSRQCREWLLRNCGSCKKGWEERRLIFRCDWERALHVAMIDDSQITEEVAKAIGFLDSEGCDLWACSGWVRR